MYKVDILRIPRKYEYFGGDEVEPIGGGKIASLQHFEKKVSKVEENQDCGIQFEGKVSVEEGDILEVYKMEERMKTLK